MLTQRADRVAAFSRRDATRLGTSAVLLVLMLTAILGADLFPERIEIEVGDVAGATISAPRAHEYISEVLTEGDRQAARDDVESVYDYTQEGAAEIAADKVADLTRLVRPVDTAFAETTLEEDRAALLETALPGLTDEARATLMTLTPETWAAVKAEATRVLDATQRAEIRDPDLTEVRDGLAGQMAGLETPQRMLAAEIIAPLIVANSAFSEELTEEEKERRAALVPNHIVQYAQNETIVRQGDRITEAQLEAIEEFGLTEARPDVVRLGGWFLLSSLIVGLLLAWIWRFREELWHRNNALLLIGLILVGMALVLKVTSGRPGLPYVIPTAAAGMLLAILLDAGIATVVTAVLALVAGAVNNQSLSLTNAPVNAVSAQSLELLAYVFLGGVAGIVAIRRGDRLQVFVQAGLAVAVVNVLVVATFGLLGLHDVQGAVELMGASVLAAAGSAVAAVGSFAVLGSLFGILTVFQLLELANPSQPLLRRLLVETPGTYHHSLMVGNLAERAAEAIGADGLLTRVAAYYHDVGKLANPLAFIENQAGGENVHDQLDPETSAQVLKQHVADGIDLAYRSKLPKTLIAFIPQHHGTAVMSYFHARARGLAAEPYGGPTTAEGAKAAAAVDDRKFRHAGPKPQSREAALIMLADGVEASVRSLASRDEPAIRAMVARIIDERLNDGQFDECELTLRDIERIKEAFVGQLLGMYHQRIAYPQNKVVEIESRRGTGTGA